MYKNMVPTDIEGAPGIIKQIKSIVRQLVNENENIRGIGISSAGQVDFNKGEIIFATDNIKGWTGTQVKRLIEEEFLLGCYVDNDVNAAAMGELVYGKYKEYKDFICMTIGTGVGGAIVQNGKVNRGSNFCAGEFGHMIIHHNGIQCNCGNKGCYEQYASVNALIRMAKEDLMDGSNGESKIDPQWLFNHYDDNKAVREVIDKYINYVAEGIVSLTHIFNPKAVLIGGAISNNEFFINSLEKTVMRKVMKSFSKDMKIFPASLRNEAALLGVAAYVFNKE